MRRIKTKLDIEKENREKQIMVGIVMIFLLIISTLGYSLMSRDDVIKQSKIEENGLEFTNVNGYWETIINNEVFIFSNLPSEVSDVNISGSYQLGEYTGDVIYFVNGEEGISEILNNIGRYALRYQRACLSEENCLDDIPIKDCNNNLIVFEEGIVSKIYKNESCVYIIGNETKGADAFLYNVLGVS